MRVNTFTFILNVFLFFGSQSHWNFYITSIFFHAWISFGYSVLPTSEKACLLTFLLFECHKGCWLSEDIYVVFGTLEREKRSCFPLYMNSITKHSTLESVLAFSFLRQQLRNRRNETSINWHFSTYRKCSLSHQRSYFNACDCKFLNFGG